MKVKVDIVTVFHNDRNFNWACELQKQLNEHEPVDRFTFTMVDNSVINRGFSKGSNLGAAKGEAPIIGFLNPDAIVDGPFIDLVAGALDESNVVITGCDFNKPIREVRAWGLDRWVCGAAMFVCRDFFDACGGFDERYVWSFEDTDLCRQAESAGHVVKPIALPIRHDSPTENSPADTRYKQSNFALANAEYYRKWR
jgi:GT2 family glycosyltransferase